MVGDETVVPSRRRAFATFRLTRGNARAQVTGDDDAFAFADEHQTTNRNFGVTLEARDFRRELGSGDEQRNAGRGASWTPGASGAVRVSICRFGHVCVHDELDSG